MYIIILMGYFSLFIGYVCLSAGSGFNKFTSSLVHFSLLFFPPPSFMAKRRTIYILLVLLALFLFGTVVVLSSISYYLSINAAAYLSDVPALDNTTRWNATEHRQFERIPRIIHQTWKSETLPTKWKGYSEACRDMMPD